MGAESSSNTTVITPEPAKQTPPAETEEVKTEAQPEEQPAPAAGNDNEITDDELEEIRRKHREQFRLKMAMKREEFLALRNSNTLEDATECMNRLGFCVNNVDTKAASERIRGGNGINRKICFVVVNTYTKPAYQLGVGPMNDAVTVAMNHKKFGYTVLYLHNSTPTVFKKWLKFLLQNTENDLTIFYTGHGCSLNDKTGDEIDGKDEVMLFDNGYVVDDELVECLSKYAHGQRIVLLSDCCHSGSMWDIQSMFKESKEVPPNIISISSAKDDQTAKQTKIEKKDQGIFSYYFWELINDNPELSTKEMEAKINPLIGRFTQHLAYATTSDSMPDEPIFIDRERPVRHRRGGRRGPRGERNE